LAVDFDAPGRLNMRAIEELGVPRAKDTNGPTPADPAGWCGGRLGAAAMPGILGGFEPKISVWMRLAATPQVPSSTARSFMKADGPHR
jgi:hypothetical protein